MKRCAVCLGEVECGNGTYRYGRLVHRLCVGPAKLIRRRLSKRDIIRNSHKKNKVRRKF
jgi:hypothetical protein